MSKPVLYEFVASVWCNVPKLAISESGYKQGDIEFKSVNLAEGANFNPDFLKLNAKGTVPVLVTAHHTYDDSTNVTRELIKHAPNPPKHDSHTDHELDKLTKVLHEESHDPNTMFVLPFDEEDRRAKANAVQAGFLGGRQKALDQFAPSAPEQFSEFLKAKQAGNKQLLGFITGEPDEAAKNKVFGDAQAQWKSAGELVRGQITHLLKKKSGEFLGGERPGEADFHLITWMAREATNAGVEPGSSSDKVIAAWKKRMGAGEIDSAVAQYWDAWVQRASFKDNGVH